MATPRPRGRPSQGLTVEARVYLSPAEVAEVDAVRGEQTRSAWLRAAALHQARRSGLVPPHGEDE